MTSLRCMLLVLCCALGTGSALLYAASGDASEAELRQLERAIASARGEVAKLAKDRSALAADIEESEKSIRELLQATTELDELLTSQQASLDSLQLQERELEQERLAQQDLLAGYLRGAWMNGSQESIKLLLNQTDPGETSRLLRYYQYFGAARAERIREFNTMLQQLAQTRRDIAEGSLALAQQQAELLQRQSELDGHRDERQSKLALLEAELKAGTGKLNDLEQQRVEMQLLLEELRSTSKATSSGTAFAANKGKLEWPVEGRISHSFGSRYDLGDISYQGVILAARAGSAVKAVHGGRVVFADWFGNSGLLLIIDHGDGYMSLYAHNQQLFKTVGARVESGEQIAAVGNTGGQSEDGLYFEIRHDGKAENPAQWCKARN